MRSQPRVTGRLGAACYAAYAGAASGPPAGFVLPATTSFLVVLKTEDSAFRPPQFLAGAHGSAKRIDGSCAPSYLEISLPPLTAYRLLGQPLDELDGTVVDFAELVGADGRRLAERVRETRGWQRRFAVVDEFLVRRLGAGPAVAPEVAAAWRRLVSDGGGTAIGRIAREVGWSHKHLITRFRQQIGLTPKTAARLVRFERARALAGTRSWDEVAAEA